MHPSGDQKGGSRGMLNREDEGEQIQDADSCL